MATYSELNRAYLEAIQFGTLEEFRDELNSFLSRSPYSYLGWLFLSRTHDALGNFQEAARSFERTLALSDPNLFSHGQLLKEIETFRNRHDNTSVSSLRLDRKGSGDISLASDSSPDIQTAEVVTDKRDHGLRQSRVAACLPHTFSSESGLKERSDGHYEQDDLERRATRAFSSGRLDEALEICQTGLRNENKSFKLIHTLAQTLQRLKRLDEALQCIREGIPGKDEQQQIALMNLEAQILSSQGSLVEAAQAYSRLVRKEKRNEARKFFLQQLIGIYRRLGSTDKAKKELEMFLALNPADETALRLKAALEKPSIVTGSNSGEPGLFDQTEAPELDVDLPDEGIDLVSPMLGQDLEKAEFRDEEILRQGGQPDVHSAQRLLQKAESRKSSEFGESYPMFLEAAKAFNELPLGTYDIGDFHRALARYAMLRGSDLLLKFSRLVKSSEDKRFLLAHLRDSALSYFLESLRLQVKVHPPSALLIITNHLRVQLASASAFGSAKVPFDPFAEQFTELFRFCLENTNDNIARVACEAVIAWGAAGGHVWNALQSVKGGPSGLHGMLGSRRNKQRIYRILSDITGLRFDEDQRPAEVLRQAFVQRLDQYHEIDAFLRPFRGISLTVQNFETICVKWAHFPLHRAPLFETDVEMKRDVEAVLAALRPYQKRSPEERTEILFTARNGLENLMAFAQENPTYWGRVHFEPLVTQWRSALIQIEKTRLKEMQPALRVSLEPPVFHIDGNSVCGALSIENVGRATAEGLALNVRLCQLDSKELCAERNDAIQNELGAGETLSCPIEFQLQELPGGLDNPYRLQVTVSPRYRAASLDPVISEFTFQTKSSATFELEDIPWNELSIPPRHMFKGRERFISQLVDHFASPQRGKTYILYGLTRTGKSSILSYLEDALDLRPFKRGGEDYRFVSFAWDMGKAKAHSSAKDMWRYLLQEQVAGKALRLEDQGLIQIGSEPMIKNRDNVRFRDWEPLLERFQKWGLYPVFLIDEFSYYRELFDSSRLDASFLAAMRSFAIGGKASFVLAGTYDLRKLIKDEAYGITGQFVNAIEHKVSRIEKAPAEELVQVMDPPLHFTKEAVEHVLRLSYRIPYFVQLICRDCALYAYHTGRTILGFPEVEEVTRVLAGEIPSSSDFTAINRIAAGVFMNNMHSPSDPREYEAVLSTICHLTKEDQYGRKVTYPEIQRRWHDHGMDLFQARLADALHELCIREVLIEDEDEGVPAYRIAVDLFRRWWTVERKFINIELDKLRTSN
ncbi:MAG: hypothetical protein ACLQPD_31180 [Desulfomonilaceae bacterium]